MGTERLVTPCTAVEFLMDVTPPSNPGNLGEKSRKYKKKVVPKKGSSFALMFFVSTKSSLVLTKSTRKSR